MNDHPNDPSNPSNPSNPDDERIDALARAARSDLRRPAPADGLTRVARARQRHQAVRAGAAGTAVIALFAIGALALRGGDENSVVPATVSTVEPPDTTVVASTVPSTTDGTVPGSTEPPPDSTPSTSPPPSTDVPPDAAGGPTYVYASPTYVVIADGDETLIDPVTGEVLGTQPMDADASRAAQDALTGRSGLRGTGRENGAEWFTTDWRVGELTFTVESLPSEVTDLDLFAPATLERFDRCGQSTLVVDGAPVSTGVLGPDGALTPDEVTPERVATIAISPDGRWLVTVSATCSEPGTLVDGPVPSEQTYRVTLFDLDQFGGGGTELFTTTGVSDTTFSADSAFVAVSGEGFRFFATATGTEVEPATDGCSASGTQWSRFIGPWIGDSSVALQLTCDDHSELLVQDLASGETARIVAPSLPGTTSWSIDVDFAHYDRPATTWITMCEFLNARCYVGRGTGSLVEVPGMVQASFLPLGFTYGG
jgi:hypothetical protein